MLSIIIVLTIVFAKILFTILGDVLVVILSPFPVVSHLLGDFTMTASPVLFLHDTWTRNMLGLLSCTNSETDVCLDAGFISEHWKQI